MLAGHLSNQDEDDVEDELASLQQQAQGPVALPNAPTSTLPEGQVAAEPEEGGQKSAQRAKGRTEARAAIPAS